MLSINTSDLAALIRATELEDGIVPFTELRVSDWVDELHSLANDARCADGEGLMEGYPAQFVRALGVLTALTPYATYGPNDDELVDVVGTVVELVVDYHGAHGMTVTDFVEKVILNDDYMDEFPFVMFVDE